MEEPDIGSLGIVDDGPLDVGSGSDESAAVMRGYGSAVVEIGAALRQGPVAWIAGQEREQGRAG